VQFASGSVQSEDGHALFVRCFCFCIFEAHGPSRDILCWPYETAVSLPEDAAMGARHGCWQVGRGCSFAVLLLSFREGQNKCHAIRTFLETRQSHREKKRLPSSSPKDRISRCFAPEFSLVGGTLLWITLNRHETA
jgi:hypothetical protein